MQRRNLAFCRTATQETDLFQPLPPLKGIALLLLALIRDMRSKPQIYSLPRESSLWIFFPDSCIVTDNFFEDYGLLMGHLSKTYPVIVRGIVENLEEGELEAAFREKGLEFRKYNCSGKDYANLFDICLTFQIQQADELQFALEMVAAIDEMDRCIAVDRRWEDLPNVAAILEPDDLSYYRYILLEDSTDLTQDYLACLTVNQIVALWYKYLEDGISSLEFDWLYDQLEQQDAARLFQWELGLHIALSQLQIQIDYRAEGFTITNAVGNKMRFDFSSSLAAEKLFLKILFPVPLQS